MPALTGPALVVAALIAIAGAQKLVDPAATAGALRALRLPSSPLLVRAGAAAELTLGTVAITAGGRITWLLVSVSYLAFTAFVVAALRAGTMIGSCGCFGREDTPPHPTHVVLNAVLAAVAAVTALSAPGAPIEAVADRPGQGAAAVALAAVTLYLLHGAYVVLPRARAAAR